MVWSLPKPSPNLPKIRRAACSARRVKDHCIFSFGNPVRRCLGEGPGAPQAGQNFLMLGPCWHFFHSWAPFFRSWLVLERFLHFFGSCWSFFSSFGSPRPRFWVVRARFQSLQNHIWRCFLALARACRRNAHHATKPQFLRCFIDFGTCRIQLQSMFFA